MLSFSLSHGKPKYRPHGYKPIPKHRSDGYKSICNPWFHCKPHLQIPNSHHLWSSKNVPKPSPLSPNGVDTAPYRTGWYFPYPSLKRYQNTCVSFRFKYRLYWVVLAIPDEISHFGRKNHTGSEHDFQFKKKEKFLDPISLSPSFSNILTYDLSLYSCRRQKITATLPESHFANLLLLPLLHLLR